jgi:hypothetical protein
MFISRAAHYPLPPTLLAPVYDVIAASGAISLRFDGAADQKLNWSEWQPLPHQLH